MRRRIRAALRRYIVGLIVEDYRSNGSLRDALRADLGARTVTLSVETHTRNEPGTVAETIVRAVKGGGGNSGPATSGA